MIIPSVLLIFCCFGISPGQFQKTRNLDNANCGKRFGADDNDGKLGVSTTQPGKFPWHVGVYKYDRFTENYEHVCGGTIISPHLVITAASCVYDTSTRAAYKPTFFRVAAGKYAFNWTTPDSNAQEVNVNDIAVPETYLGDINSYSENIAVINLARDLYLNDLVFPICFDMNNAVYNIKESNLLTAGWGFKGDVRYSPYLKGARFQFISIAECRKKFNSIRYLRFINYDKTCILTPEGRRDHDTGVGLVYKKGNKYHLLGVMSAYINNDFSPATNLSRHLRWINNTIELFDKSTRCKDGFRCLDGTCVHELLVCDDYKDCPDGTDESQETCPSKKTGNKNSCLLPTQAGGVSYTKQLCETNCELKGGEYIEQNSQVQLNCGKGFAPKEVGLKPIYVCTQGQWFPESPECIKLCNPLKKPNVNFVCTYKNEKVNCDTFMKPGTIGSYNCSLHYRMADPSAFIGHVTCGEKGTWIEPIPTCHPECGIENPADTAQLTISFGKETKHGKYPWHVAIYLRLDYNGTYVNICGGTLINEHMVLTAAHCMFNQANARFKEDQLRVAAGKFYRNWDKHGQHQQTSRVSNILVQETYGGYQTHYEQDIAMLNVEISFIFSDFVLPACIDYSPRLNSMKPNTVGTMVGWGMTETLEYSDELREIQLPILKTVDCRNRFRQFVSYITSDKFCVLYINGGGTQQGDSGGGLTLKSQDRHFIYGVISIKKKDENLFAALTNVSNHFDWIRQTLNVYSRQRKLSQNF